MRFHSQVVGTRRWESHFAGRFILTIVAATTESLAVCSPAGHARIPSGLSRRIIWLAVRMLSEAPVVLRLFLLFL